MDISIIDLQRDFLVNASIILYSHSQNETLQIDFGLGYYTNIPLIGKINRKFKKLIDIS